MTVLIHRADLGSFQTPLIAEEVGRPVMIAQYDAQTLQGENTASVFYGHNVFPTKYGVRSVGFSRVVSEKSPDEQLFSKIYLIRNTLPSGVEEKFYLGVTSDGRNYICSPSNFSWVETTTVVNAEISVAYAAGTTYIFFKNYGCYKYVSSSNSLVAVTLTGLDVSKILGIIAFADYLLAYSNSAISWSSTLDATDFVPSSVTGAGGGSISQVRGNITFCAPAEDGFIVFTSRNAVVANYTGNSAFPFTFTELPAAGGVNSSSLISSRSNTSTLISYTTSGLQKFEKTSVKNILPEVTDFLAGGYFEDFNEISNYFERTELSGVLKKSLEFVSNRYLVISYGVSELTHALVIDVDLNKVGKIKLTHVDCIEFELLEPEVTESPKSSIAFLKKDGEVVVVDFGASVRNGVLILGKYQFIRNRSMRLEKISLERVRTHAGFKVITYGDFEGVAPVEAVKISDGNYGVSLTRRNHSIILKGDFNLTVMELHLTVGGTF